MHIARVAAAISLSLSAASAAPRNVVLMIGDDHGLELGCYGHPVVQTPHLDRLAQRGTRFTNAFAAVASCSASRSTLYAGMFNHSTGQFGHAHRPHNLYSFPDIPSLPKSLNQAGYRTAILGKLHVQPESVYPFGEQLSAPGGARSVAEMADAAKAFMSRDPDRPFLLVVGYIDTHRAGRGFGNEQDYKGVQRVAYKPEDVFVPPFLPDLPETRADLADYYASVSRLDQGVGLMLDAVAASGHADDTLIIYLSDNGIPFPGAKTTLYEPGIHLPLLIASPQQNRGVVNNAMASWVDIAPTILDWTGTAVPKEMAGRSLMPILDETDPPGWDTVHASHTFHEITMYYPMRMIRTRQYKYILNLAHGLDYPFASDLWASPTWQAALKQGIDVYGKRRVSDYIHRPKEELYDLETDPDELRILAGEPNHAGVLADLRTRLRAWQEQTKDPWLVKYKYE